MGRWTWISLVLTCAAFAASGLVYWNRLEWLPEQVPVHWGFSGEPDAWTPREGILGYLLLPPLLMVGMFGLAWLLPWLSPRNFAIDANRKVFDYCMFLLVALFGLLHAVILVGYLRPEFPLVRALILALAIFFVLLGNVLGQVPRNFFMGVRTPWTLASNLVWVKTHRLAAWLFVGIGLLTACLTLLGAPYWLIFFAMLPPLLYPVLYSFILYKRLERAGQLEAA